MIILGDISGIQTYLFDVADAGGGQARRLRARSFYIQLLAEAAALRVLGALGSLRDGEHYLMSGAGKFLLKGIPDSKTEEKLRSLQQEFSGWLLRNTRGELRISLGWADGNNEVEAYRAAMGALQRTKLRPWAPAHKESWNPAAMVLPPLDKPCSLCGHATAIDKEFDNETGEERWVCERCATDKKLGAMLPRALWLEFLNNSSGADIDLFGLGVRISDVNRPPIDRDVLCVANLKQPDHIPDWCPAGLFIDRPFMAYIPTQNGIPKWFVEIARQSRGDHLLGVLKADVDSLGVAFENLLKTSADLKPLIRFGGQLDRFFSQSLNQELETGADQRWRSIYTVFAGGDDLLLVGPWDVMFDFAGRLRELFQKEFGARGLTLSAGLSLIKPRRPIKPAVKNAEHLLEKAKTSAPLPASSPKDAIAAFGQHWKWDHHSLVMREGKKLAGWVEQGQCNRGWLHTLLTLTDMRLGDKDCDLDPNPLATSRLAYHVARNYPRHSPMRPWGEQLINRFDSLDDPEVRLLPAMLRYALTATRTLGEED
jgi:CRISPR-associated protein Csm1